MSTILPCLIIALVLIDIVLSYKSSHVSVRIRIKRKEEANNVELLVYQQYTNKKMKLEILQICIRFLLMAAWIVNSMYFTAVVCFLLALLYSIQIYFGVNKVIDLRRLKKQFALANLNQTNKDDSNDIES